MTTGRLKKLMIGSYILIGLSGCAPPQSKVIDRLPPPLFARMAAAIDASPTPPMPNPPDAPVVGKVAPDWTPPGGFSNRWNTIVVHHTATAAGSAASIDRAHRDRGWDGLGYHFVIGNGTGAADGQVEVGYRWREQAAGAHCRLTAAYARQRGVSDPGYYNEHGIGIVLIGDFEKTRPTAAQMKSLAVLVAFLMDKCNIPESRVFVHGGLDQTKCPGHNFSLADLKRRVRELR